MDKDAEGEATVKLRMFPRSASKLHLQLMKSQMEKALQPFMDQAQRNLKESHRNLVKMFEEDVGQASSSILGTDANPNFEELLRSFERQCINLMRFVLEYALTEKEVKLSSGPTESRKDEMKRLVILLHHIKSHLHSHPSASALRSFTNKLFHPPHPSSLSYDYVDSDEEGFFDALSEHNSSVAAADSRQIPFAKIGNVNQGGSSGDEWDSMLDGEEGGMISRKQLAAMENKIEELTFKLKSREEIVQVLTTGYVKDIQHMKEMLFRQANIEEVDFYEVQYFDCSAIIDESTRVILNDKIFDLKAQFEKKTQDLLKKVLAMATEHTRLNKALAAANAAAAASLTDPNALQEAIKKIFMIEDNPYKVWKALQDFKGNSFFFKVFENQRPEFGINYKEVNKMLTSKKAYEAEYADYRALLDEQLCSMIVKSSSTLEDLSRETAEKNARIEELERILESERERNRQDQVELIASMKGGEDSQQCRDCLCSGNRVHLVKSMWKRWANMGRVASALKTVLDGSSLEDVMKEVKRAVFGNQEGRGIIIKRQGGGGQEEKEEEGGEERQSFFKLQEQCAEYAGKIEELKASAFLAEKEARAKQAHIDMLTLRVKEKTQLATQLQNAKSLLSFEKSIAQSTLTMILNKLGMKVSDDQFKEIDLENEKKLSTKQFMNALANLDGRNARAVREIKCAAEKMEEVAGELKKAQAREKLIENGCQTKTYGIHTEFTEMDSQEEFDDSAVGSFEKQVLVKCSENEKDFGEQREEGDASRKGSEERERGVSRTNDEQNSQPHSQRNSSSENRKNSHQDDDDDNNKNNSNNTEGEGGNPGEKSNEIEGNTASEGLVVGHRLTGEGEEGSGVTNAGEFQDHEAKSKQLILANKQKEISELKSRVEQQAKDLKESTRQIQELKAYKESAEARLREISSLNKHAKQGQSNSITPSSDQIGEDPSGQQTRRKDSVSKQQEQDQQVLGGNSKKNSVSSTKKGTATNDIKMYSKLLGKNVLSQRGSLVNEAIMNGGGAAGQQYESNSSSAAALILNLSNPSIKFEDEMKEGIGEQAGNAATTGVNSEQQTFQSKNKSERSEELKAQLQKIEIFHWEEVLSLLNLYSRTMNNEDMQRQPSVEDLYSNDGTIRNEVNGQNNQYPSLSMNEMKRLHSRPMNSLSDHQSLYLKNRFNSVNQTLNRAESQFKRNKDIQALSQNLKKEIDYAQQTEAEEGSESAELKPEIIGRRRQYLEQIFDAFRDGNYTTTRKANELRACIREKSMKANNNLASNSNSTTTNGISEEARTSRALLNQYASGNSSHMLSPKQLDSLDMSTEKYQPNGYHLVAEALRKESKKLKPIQVQVKQRESLSNSYLNSIDSSRLHTNTTKEKIILQKIKSDMKTPSIQLVQKNRVNKSIGNIDTQDTNLFLPDSITPLVKKGQPVAHPAAAAAAADYYN